MKCPICNKEINGFFCARELSYNEDGTGEVLATAFEAATKDGEDICRMCKMRAMMRLRDELVKEMTGEK